MRYLVKGNDDCGVYPYKDLSQIWHFLIWQRGHLLQRPIVGIQLCGWRRGNLPEKMCIIPWKILHEVGDRARISWSLFASQNKLHQNSLFGCSIHKSWTVFFQAEWATPLSRLFHSNIYIFIIPSYCHHGWEIPNGPSSIHRICHCRFVLLELWSVSLLPISPLQNPLMLGEWKSLVTMGELEFIYLGYLISVDIISPSTSNQQDYHISSRKWQLDSILRLSTGMFGGGSII